MSKNVEELFEMSMTINKDDLRDYPNNILEFEKGCLYLEAEIEKEVILFEKAKLLSKLAGYQRSLKKLELSIKNQLEAIIIFEKLEKNSNLFVAKIRLAHAFQFNEEYKKAREIFDYLLVNLEKDTSLENYRDFLYQHIGKNEFEAKNYETALNYFQQALAIRTKKADFSLISSTEIAIKKTLELVKNK